MIERSPVLAQSMSERSARMGTKDGADSTFVFVGLFHVSGETSRVGSGRIGSGQGDLARPVRNGKLLTRPDPAARPVRNGKLLTRPGPARISY